MKWFDFRLLITVLLISTLSINTLFAQDEDSDDEESIQRTLEDEEAPLVSAVSAEQKEKEKTWNTVQMPFNYQNIQVPRLLWEKLRSTLLSDGIKEKDLKDYAIVPISLKFEMFSEDKTVLKDGLNQRIIFQEGGGVVDLFDTLTGKGLFYIRFSPSLVDDNPFHLFYISDSPIKDRGGEKMGNGCGKIFDLTDKAAVFLENNGIKLTSSKKHYMHLMAGTYVFFQFIVDRLYLGYIQILDSRYPQFTCKSE